LGVGRKADDLAVYKHYCHEIQRNENRVQSGRISYRRIRLKKGCFANDDGDDDDMN
jgi:hypothetical protein